MSHKNFATFHSVFSIFSIKMASIEYRGGSNLTYFLTLQPLQCDYYIRIHCDVAAEMIYCCSALVKICTHLACACNSDLKGGQETCEKTLDSSMISN